LAIVSVVQREWAAHHLRTLITVEDILNSRMIAHRFWKWVRRLDCRAHV
jgi:hypothetical protein